MNIGIISAFPPSKVTLNEYGYYLVKNFVLNDLINKVYLYSDITNEAKLFDFKNSEKIDHHPCWSFNSYLSTFNILREVYKTKPEVVLINAHFLKFADKKIPAAFGLMLGFFLKLMGYKSIFLLHNIIDKVDLGKAGFTNNKLLTYIYTFIGNTLTRFILQSNIVAVTIDQYVDILEEKHKSDNVVLIPHGSLDIPNVPAEFKHHDVKKIMTFGKFGTYKKVEQLIDAVIYLKNNTTFKYEIIIAGTDSPNTIGYLEDVKNKYKDIDYLTFTGYIPESEVEKVFTESTVVVFPYTSTTGSSGVLHQAGCYSKAVVMPKIDDLEHLIEEEGYKGEYFDPTSTISLAKAIQKIVEDDSYRYELEQNNFNAATSLPMYDIVRWYIGHMLQLTENNNSKTNGIDKTLMLSHINISNYKDITKELDSWIDANKILKIDISQLNIVDIAGINTLIHAKIRAVENKLQLYFIGEPQYQMKRWRHYIKLYSWF